MPVNWTRGKIGLVTRESARHLAVTVLQVSLVENVGFFFTEVRENYGNIGSVLQQWFWTEGFRQWPVKMLLMYNFNCSVEIAKQKFGSEMFATDNE